MARGNGILSVLLGAALCGQAALAQAQISIPSAPSMGGGIAVGPIGGVPLSPNFGSMGTISQPLGANSLNRGLSSIPNLNVPQAATAAPVGAVAQPMGSRINSGPANVSRATETPSATQFYSQPAREQPSSSPPSVSNERPQTPAAAQSPWPGTKSVPTQAHDTRSQEKVKASGGHGGKGEGGDGDSSDGDSLLKKIPWWVWLILVLILLGAMDSRK